jgi:choline kinase
VKALILAAGQSTQIHLIYGDRPKCLIPFNNSEWTILDQQIHSLFSTRVEDIGIVVGYEKDQIIRHVRSNYRACLDHFRFIENPAFAETNNIYSLWLAREWLGFPVRLFERRRRFRLANTASSAVFRSSDHNDRRSGLAR